MLPEYDWCLSMLTARKMELRSKFRRLLLRMWLNFGLRETWWHQPKHRERSGGSLPKVSKPEVSCTSQTGQTPSMNAHCFIGSSFFYYHTFHEFCQWILHKHGIG